MSFDYGEVGGPHTWALKFPNAAGSKQSPINIDKKSAHYDSSLESISINVEEVSKYTVDMGAHNFHVLATGKGTLRGGPLKSEYLLQQFHFHWGAGDTWGSEHQINGISSPSELHCVFRNSKYNINEEVLKRQDGLCVVGVFLKLGEDNNQALDELCSAAVNLKSGEECVLQPNFSLASILPKDLSKYYTYPGSLTTPPCSECVTWIVMNEPVTITHAQLDKFRHTHNQCRICGCTNNFRPVCPVGSRRILCSFHAQSP
jgi:carbonic anhydrase